jgi:hypothetical protein
MPPEWLPDSVLTKQTTLPGEEVRQSRNPVLHDRELANNKPVARAATFEGHLKIF